MFIKSPHSNEFLFNLRVGAAVAEASLLWDAAANAYRLSSRGYWDDPDWRTPDGNAVGMVHAQLDVAVHHELTAGICWKPADDSGYLWLPYNGRYVIERDDGDDGIGWGHSFACYECIDGTWVAMNMEFTRCYERITLDSPQRCLQDVAAIIGKGDQGPMVVAARKLFDPEPGFIPDNGFQVFERGYDGFMHEAKRYYPPKKRPSVMW